ncbi:glycerophosphodiester phosphodiesterase family protein [Flavivirga jejuensis]|uniref:Glycerophosphodiester phosphodiesterase family protein n=1 Tax=Flavivirga jejuensis TaxID=870487 RepID=A0ABT8WKJ1_9FLAO|nr:glycerophosphodiester phosphodiesterase family protein [Flavivirga jejuensis]MDO5973509.1 glycerophosphodiester phosphodiesterase family protein [Flavivirga jejuensis]
MIKTRFSISALLSQFIMVCFLIGCSKSDDAIPNNNTLVKASFYTNDSEQDLLVGDIVRFNNTVTVNNAIVNYSWDFGDGQTSSQKNPSHTYTEPGDYIVTLTVSIDDSKSSFSKELPILLTSNIINRNTLIEALSELSNKILICAHRGQHEDAPENSLLSISNAINQSLRMVELDVRQTQDGALVLMHDATINRTTNGIGEIDKMTFEALQQFNLFKEDGTLTTQKIPSLKEVLSLARGKIYLDLDIDNKVPYSKVYQLVKQYGMLNQVIFYSSEYSDISGIFKVDSNAYAMPIIRNQEDFSFYYNAFQNLNIVHYTNASFNNELVSTAKQKGWFIFKNAYVNSNESPTTDASGQIKKAIDLEADIIQTDYPTQVKNYLNSQNLN